MKELPETGTSYGALYEKLVAPIGADLMLTGIKLGVFDFLREPAPAEEIAGIYGISPQSSRALLDGLTACELLIKKDGRYTNAPVSREFLVQDSPTYVGGFLDYYSDYLYSTRDRLSRLLKTGLEHLGESPQRDMRIPERSDYVSGLAAYQKAGAARLIAGEISRLPEFPSMRKMLDLGGGPGIIGMAVVDAHPDLRGALYDLPDVCAAAGKYIEEYGMEDRMEILGGNYDRDSIGEGYDLVLASATLHISADMDALIAKIYASLNRGGLLVSFHEGLTDEMTQPAIHVLGYLAALLSGRDMAIEKGRIVASMLRAGFEHVSSRTLDTPMGPLELDIARKT